MFKNPQTLMIQGTTSDAGKSIAVTALCRMLARKGISVAPMKPQNMALNSAVADGGEIGRAQAVQAEAAFLKPSVLMNPVLIKPNSDTGAQVIVHGKPLQNMDAQAYHQYKPKLLGEIIECHDKLRDKYGVVIVEGAGSPAEINLRDNDIANMGFAEEVDCPVVLIADIDRGGVFAHLYGTLELLSQSEQDRVVGFIINRFRGDLKLLQGGLDWLEKKTGKPVLAVVPYIHNLHIESEDSILPQQTSGEKEQMLNVFVPVYPRVSNHTDFDVLRLHPQVNLQFVNDINAVEKADLIILPGSKNVRSDLAWLKENGWLEIINKHIRYGGRVLGICGGYQMLGNIIHDPEAVEMHAGSTEGLGFLDMETTLLRGKTLRNVEGELIVNGAKVCGYEIHAGVTQGAALEKPLFTLSDKEASQQHNDGAISDDGKVLGSYVHGLFDQEEVLGWLLSWAGLQSVKAFDYEVFRNDQINRLADEFEKALPLEKLTELLCYNEKNDISALMPVSNFRSWLDDA